MNAPLPQVAALSLYDETACTDSGQYFCNDLQFALPVQGNKVERLSSGEHVYREVLLAMKAAEKFIWIADWQMAFDVELGDRGKPDHPGRLIKVFENIIKNKPVQIRVLLYCSVLDSAPGTYDGLVSRTINAINRKDYPGKVIVQIQKPTSAQQDSHDYSHHQKFVVVDGNVGFIGGLDLTHGRFETPEFDVVIDPSRYVLNEARNPCTANLRGVSPAEEELIKLGFHKPYAGALLEEGCQARMPWQDVHVKITGPSVVDIHRNFVRRWNAMARVADGRSAVVTPQAHRVAKRTAQNETVERSAEINDDWLHLHDAAATLKTAQTAQPGRAVVQIVRSVSSRHLRQEAFLSGQFSPPDDLKLLPNPEHRAVVSDCMKAWVDEHQPNILNAMVNCIRSADNYVYIETQFFISDFGVVLQARKTVNGGKEGNRMMYLPVVDSTKIGNENDGIKNTILDALAERIGEHIVGQTKFHVYLVLPVHPEGSIADGSVWKQHWLALATIHHGDRSLIGRIKKTLKDNGRAEDEWKKYLTVLNMRNHGVAVQYARDKKTFKEDYTREIGRYVITEQIYIHSKLLIVDDAVAIVGSANINDRSLTGNGDTEIAAVIVDTDDVKLEDLGDPAFKVRTRKFARELRRSLWEKHFGFTLSEDKYFQSISRAGHQAAPAQDGEHLPRKKTSADTFTKIAETPWQTVLDKPCHPDTVKAIQRIADNNRVAYEAVFTHTPRNGMKGFENILEHFTRSYASVANSLFKNAESEAESSRIRARQMVYGNSLSETQKAQAYTEIDRSYAQQLKTLEATLGVVPPALQSAYMTSSLLPHQQEALRLPVTDVRTRYVTYEGDQVHNIKAATEYLREKLVGFFVTAPLHWGEGTKVDSGIDHHMSVDIALNTQAASTGSNA